jgi:2'-5' RNA ligase
MKAAIALLSDYRIQNVARKMVYEINRHGGIKFFGPLLPAHVSLKQPFTFEDMNRLEAWFDSFSKRVPSLRIELDHIYHDTWNEYAIVGFGVRETPTLRDLHNQINRELRDVVHDPSAPHDGEGYRFHLTVELGKVGSLNPFKRFYDSIPEKRIDLSFVAEHIAHFFYAEEPIEPGSFICYKVLT